MRELLNDMIAAAREAGRAIMDVYAKGEFDVRSKSDGSPVTLADRRSHEIIKSRLNIISPGVPVISEEGSQIPHMERGKWDRFFLVDPLDGTKEFIKQTGEFTINIALIENGSPVLGLIHIPVADAAYYAYRGGGAYKINPGLDPEKISVRDIDMNAGFIAACSRSHGLNRLDEFLKGINVQCRISAGSALKFCLVAEGRADIYPRFGPTYEWDTAAGHAILIEAGGEVIDPNTRKPLAYNKESLEQSGFIAGSKAALRSLGFL